MKLMKQIKNKPLLRMKRSNLFLFIFILLISQIKIKAQYPVPFPAGIRVWSTSYFVEGSEIDTLSGITTNIDDTSSTNKHKFLATQQLVEDYVAESISEIDSSFYSIKIGTNDDTTTINTDGTIKQYYNGSKIFETTQNGYIYQNSNFNIVLGYNSLQNLTSAQSGVFIGYDAGANITSGNSDIFIGRQAGYNTTTGGWNVGIGQYTFSDNHIGIGKVAIGYSALQHDTVNYNTAIGYIAGQDNISGINNLYLGSYAGKNATTLSNRIYINSLNRGSILNDTILSPIYIYQAASTEDQEIYLNGNANLAEDLQFSDGSIQKTSAGLDTIINITSSNFLNGDSLGILPAPGSGYAYIIKSIHLIYTHNTIAYSGAGTHSIYWYSLGSPQTYMQFLATQQTVSYSSSLEAKYTSISRYPIDENSEVWIKLYNSLTTGDGTGYLYVQYKKMEL